MTAPNATLLLSMGRPRMKAKNTMKSTALMGVPLTGLTLAHSLCPVQCPQEYKMSSFYS